MAEEKVLHHYREKGFRLLKQRLRTPYAEIDLLLEAPEDFLVMVEVKSVSDEAFISSRISRRQRSRQDKALLYLSEIYGKNVAIHWAFVMNDGNLIVLEDISV